MGAITLEPSKANADSVIDHVWTLARTVANRQITRQMSAASNIVTNFSGTIREIGNEVQKRQPNEALANLTGSIVTRVDGVAAYLDNTHPENVVADVKRFSGEQPIVAAGLAIIVGFGAARVVRVAADQNKS